MVDLINANAWRRRIGFFGTDAEWEAIIAGGGAGPELGAHIADQTFYYLTPLVSTG